MQFVFLLRVVVYALKIAVVYKESLWGTRKIEMIWKETLSLILYSLAGRRQIKFKKKKNTTKQKEILLFFDVGYLESLLLLYCHGFYGAVGRPIAPRPIVVTPPKLKKTP